MVAKVLWHDWFPSVWLDQHQQGNAARECSPCPPATPSIPTCIL